jgi:hypothetical protein
MNARSPRTPFDGKEMGRSTPRETGSIGLNRALAPMRLSDPEWTETASTSGIWLSAEGEGFEPSTRLDDM